MAEVGAEGAGEKHTKPFVPARFLEEGKRASWHNDKINAVKKALGLEGHWPAEAQQLLEHLLENRGLRVDKAVGALSLTRPHTAKRAKKEQEEAAKKTQAEALQKEQAEATQRLSEATEQLSASSEKAGVMCRGAVQGRGVKEGRVSPVVI